MPSTRSRPGRTERRRVTPQAQCPGIATGTGLTRRSAGALGVGYMVQCIGHMIEGIGYTSEACRAGMGWEI